MSGIKVSKPDKPKRLGVKRVSIDTAGNGFVSETRFHTTGNDYDDEGDKNVHKNTDELAAYIKSIFNGGDNAGRRRSAALSVLNREKTK